MTDISSSYNAIAQNLLEQLSENISKLILMVVELMEQDAPLPTFEISAVGNSASTLSEIAIMVANQEYHEYPSIQKEIIDGASQMQYAKSRVDQAVENFTKVPRRKGWSEVAEGCRAIGNETIKILHIVFGAELKRLEAAASMALEALESCTLDMLKVGNEQAFADHVQSTVQELLKYSTLLNERANDEVAPAIQAELANIANQLGQDGNLIIDTTNQLLEALEVGLTTDTPSINFAKLVQKTCQAVRSSIESVKEHNTNNGIHLITTPQRDVKEEEKEEEEDTETIEELLKAMSKGITEIMRATYKGDKGIIEVLSNTLSSQAAILGTTKNGSSIPQLVQSYIDSCHAVLETPNNTTHLKQMGDNCELVQSQLQAMATSRDLQMMNLIKNKEECLKIMSESSEPSVLVNTARALTRTAEKMEKLMKPSDPSEINGAVQKIGELLQKQISQVKLFVRDTQNPEYRKQLDEINLAMHEPLSYLAAVMEPTNANEAHETTVKERATSKRMVEAVAKGDHKAVDTMVRELEKGVSSLIALSTSETMFDTTPSEDGELDKATTVSEASKKLVALLSRRRALANEMTKTPTNGGQVPADLQIELEQVNNAIGDLCVVVADCVTSDIGLLQMKLMRAIRSGNNPQMESLLKEINNRSNIPIHAARSLDAIKGDTNKSKFFEAMATDLQSFVQIQATECRSGPSRDVERIEYLGEEITSKFNDLQQQINLQNHFENSKYNNQDQPSSSSIQNGNLTNIIEEIEMDSVRREGSEDPKETSKKILELFQELITNLKKSDAGKSIVSTMRQLIAEQDKLVLLASSIMSKTLSDQLKQQIEASITLFKQSIQNAIATSGKIKQYGDQQKQDEILSKCMATIKKSTVELDHILRLDNDVEMVGAYQELLDPERDEQHLPLTFVIDHFTEYTNNRVGGINNGGNRSTLLISGDKARVKQLIDRLLKLKKNNTANIDEYSNAIYGILVHWESFVNASLVHQSNAKYHLITAYEMNQDETVSNSLEAIVALQADLIECAEDYLQSHSSDSKEKIEQTKLELLSNSLRVAKQSLSQQVETAIQYLDKKIIQQQQNNPNQQNQSIDKLLTVIDVIRDSVETCTRAAFTAPLQVEMEKWVDKSLAGFLPTLSLTSSFVVTNPTDGGNKDKFETLVKDITDNLNTICSITDAKVELKKQLATILEPEELKLPHIVHQEKQLLNKLLSYTIDSDTQGIVDTSRSLVKAHQDMVSICESLNKGVNDQNVIDSCAELTQLIPQQLSTIKQAIQGTDDTAIGQYQQRSQHIASQIHRNLDSVLDHFVPQDVSSYHATQFKKNSKLYTEALPKINDKEEVRLRLTHINKHAQNVLDHSNNCHGFCDPERQSRIREAIQNLEMRLRGKTIEDNLDISSGKMLEDFKLESNKNTYEKSRKDTEEAIAKVMNETAQSSLALVSQQRAAIRQLVLCSVRGNFNKIIENSKQVLNKQRTFKAQLQKDLDAMTNDPIKKQKIQSAQLEMDNLLPEIIKASKDLILNPTEQPKRHTLETLLIAMDAPITTITSELLQPSQASQLLYNGNDVPFEQLVKQYQSILSKTSSLTSNPEKREEANNNLKQLSDIQTRILSHVRLDKNSTLEPTLRDQLNDVSNVIKECFDAAASNGGVVPNKLQVEKDFVIFNLNLSIDHLTNLHHQNQLEQVRTLHQQNDVGKTSQSSYVKNVINSIKSNDIVSLSSNPDKLNKYLQIKNTNLPTAQQQKPPQPSKPTPTNTKKPQPTKQPIKLDPPVIKKPINNNQNHNTNNNNNNNNNGKIEDIATKVSKQIESISEMKDLSMELQVYSQAIKSNQRQQIINSGRNIATLINKLCEQVDPLAKTCRNPPLQTKLYGNIGSLKTLACQLKIMSSVKAAASSMDDPDSDSQLSSLLSILGTTLNDLSNSLNTHRLTSTPSRI